MVIDGHESSLDKRGLASFETVPAPVNFYIARHGETLFNVMGKVQGWCDTPLTDEGIRGAEALGRGFAGVDFTAAFSSDSGRAAQTLETLLRMRADVRGEVHESNFSFPKSPGPGAHQGPSLPVFRDERLREWCYGDLEGEPGSLLHAALTAGFGRELSFEEHNSRLPEVADIIVAADRSGRAERFDAIEGRLRAFFNEVGEAVHLDGGGNVLVVTHSFAVRTLVYLLDVSRVNNPLKIANASVTQIRYDGTSFELGEIGSTAWSQS